MLGSMAIITPSPRRGQAGSHLLSPRPSVSTLVPRALPNTTRLDSLPARLATITTDTGAFAPGRRNFADYDAPGLCLAAATWTRTLLQRSMEAQEYHDAMLLIPERDTVGATGVAAVARACQAHLTLAHLPKTEVDEAFQLALLAQNDSLAHAIVAQQVARAVTLTDTISIVSAVLEAYLTARPVRTASAQALVASFDAFGRPAHVARQLLHVILLNFYTRYQDTALLREEANRMITLSQQVPPTDVDEFDAIGDAYNALIALAVFAHSDSVPILETQAREALHTLLTPSFAKTFNEEIRRKTGETWDLHRDRAEIDKMIAAPLWYEQIQVLAQEPVQRFPADYWFPSPGSASSDTVRPVPGKVNLICMTGGPDGNQSADLFDWQMFGADLARHLRRWMARYGSQGLVVTVVAAVDGQYTYDQDNPLNQVFSSAGAGAEFWRRYVQDYEHLPVAVAVQVFKHRTWLPAPDGRWRTQEAIPFEAFAHVGEPTRHYIENNMLGACTIVDRDGKKIWTRSMTNFGEERPDRMLQWLFSRNSTTSVPNSAVTPVQGAAR